MVPPADLPPAGPPPGKPQVASFLPSAVGYEIFVRSFADSNGDGNGDLQGITAHLDYLADLGVNLLWLTPIHPSPSYHGYDVTDYDAVHPDFGTAADLDQLLGEAHRRGMRVILDLVANHTSNQHPWFVAAQKDAPTGGPEAGRYLFRRDDPGWPSGGRHYFKPLPGTTGPYYYSYFSGSLPDLNYRDPRVVQAMQAVVTHWLAVGADGYRLDAARYLVEWPDPVSAISEPAVADTADNHRVLHGFRAVAEAHGGSAPLIGEVWTDVDTIASYRGEGDELHACFHFPLAGALLDGVQRGDPQPIRDALVATLRTTVPLGFFAPFLSNHDQQRSATTLMADPARMRLAATLLLAMPGPPFLYYGEEIGLGQSKDPKDSGDRAQRTPMPWGLAQQQQADPSSLRSHYRRLIQLRNSTPALRDERTQVLDASDGRLLALGRGSGPQAVVAVFNLAADAVAGAKVNLPGDYPSGAQKDLLTAADAPAVTEDNRARYPLPAVPARGAVFLTASTAAP
jgi:glycosidase